MRDIAITNIYIYMGIKGKMKRKQKWKKKNKPSDLHDSIYLLAMQLTGN